MSAAVNRKIILALPKREKMATYREIARANNLCISRGIEKAVDIRAGCKAHKILCTGRDNWNY